MRADTEIKQHISAIIHEATQTFDLTDRRLAIQGILFKSENRLFGGEQSIFLRLTLLLIELLREHAFRNTGRDRFLSKEQAADPLCCKIISYLQAFFARLRYPPCALFQQNENGGGKAPHSRDQVQFF